MEFLFFGFFWFSFCVVISRGYKSYIDFVFISLIVEGRKFYILGYREWGLIVYVYWGKENIECVIIEVKYVWDKDIFFGIILK